MASVSSPSPPIVKLKNVDFSYNGQAVLQNVSLTIHQDDFIGVIGPNGGGKSTLLKLILGLLKPIRGRVKVMGETHNKKPPVIGYVPQNIHFNTDFPIKAMDVVMMGKLGSGSRLKGHSKQDKKEALKILERLDMEGEHNKKIGELSGGQRQRILIARALMTRSRLLLLDEPTASIDTKGQADFYKMLETLNSEVAILVVSHDLFAISNFVKSVACVNKGLHYHSQAEIKGDMLNTMYSCSVEEVCRAQLMAQGFRKKPLVHIQEKMNGNS